MVVDRPSPTHVTVRVDTPPGSPPALLDVSVAELDAWNGPHSFLTPHEFVHGSATGARRGGGGSTSPQRRLQFEDGVKADYTSMAMRARLCEAALAIDAVAGTLNFADEAASATTLDAQILAVRTLRKVMNITPLQNGVDRRREARSLSVARLITYGQGHCHGLTSTAVAVVLPFASALGLEVKYRNGFMFPCRGTDAVSNTRDVHHWVEVTYLPSGRTCVHDPSLAFKPEPMEDAYSETGGYYPRCLPLQFQRV